MKSSKRRTRSDKFPLKYTQLNSDVFTGSVNPQLWMGHRHCCYKSIIIAQQPTKPFNQSGCLQKLNWVSNTPCGMSMSTPHYCYNSTINGITLLYTSRCVKYILYIYCDPIAVVVL